MCAGQETLCPMRRELRGLQDRVSGYQWASILGGHRGNCALQGGTEKLDNVTGASPLMSVWRPQGHEVMVSSGELCKKSSPGSWCKSVSYTMSQVMV